MEYLCSGPFPFALSLSKGNSGSSPMELESQTELPELQPPVNIVGEQVALGPMRKDLIPAYAGWYNNLQMLRSLGDIPQPLTPAQKERWYENANTASGSNITFTIFERHLERPIGITGLYGVDFRNRTAEFAITIAESDARGRGYGTEATRLMLDYAFTALGLHNVMLRVFSFNIAGIRTYAKAGFKKFGRRRECYLMGGKTWDVIYMECLASEWGPSPLLAETFKPDERRLDLLADGIRSP